MIEKISVKEMTNDQWLEARRNSIGGSDAATVLGLNHYNSAYSLWCDKTRKITTEDISDREAVRLGHDLEQYVADRFMEATGKKVRRENYIIKNSLYPFAHANPDRMVIGEKAGLECKTTSSFEIEKMLEAGQIPPYWYCQCVHYLMVTGADRWYLGAIVFGRGFYWFTVERDEAEISALAYAEHEFWDLVETNTPPSIDGSESTTAAIKTIFKESDGTQIDLTGVEHVIIELITTKKRIKELEEMQTNQENIIKDYMGSAEKGICKYGSVTWKTSTRKSIDKKKLDKDHVVLDDKYYTVTESRTFRTNLKEAI